MTSSPHAHAAAPAPAPDRDQTRKNVIGALLFPLFFVVMFSLCYVSAFHSPRPNDAHLILVGPSATTAEVAQGLEKQVHGGFDVTTTEDLAKSRQQVLDRKAVGVIRMGDEVTSYVATGASATSAQIVEKVAAGVAAQAELPLVTKDLRPVQPSDAPTTALFYLMVVCSIIGYLTITVLTQAAPKLRLRSTYAILAGASVIGPAIAMAIEAIFVGNYGASVGTLALLYGVAAIYSFTVGTISVLAHQLLGQSSIFVVMTLVIFLNFPSAGGAIPAPMLPDFWQHLHSFWFGSGAQEAMRSIVYFGGSQSGRWLFQMFAWLVVAGALSLAVALRRNRSEVVGKHAEQHPVVDGVPVH